MSTSPLGRRRPFIIALSVLACLSIVGLVASDTEGISPSGQIVLIFICYPFFDISHDCMLVPGRALLTDIAEEADGMEETEADLYYTAAQSGGRATAMLIGCLPWKRILHESVLSDVSKFQLLMSFCFVVVVVCAAASWIAGAREVPLEQHIHSQQHEEAPNSPEVVQGDEEFEEEDGQVFWLLLVILSVQTTGWVSLNALCFWWMPFLDHAKLDWLFDTDAAFVGLALQAMVSFCLAGQVSVAWCRAWGETKLWLFGEGLMAMALGSTRWVDRNNPGLTVVVVHTNLHKLET